MNRFAFLPLTYDLREDAVNKELIIDPNTGHVYIKGLDGEIRSKTADLEAISINLGNSINTLNTKIGGIYFKIENDLLKTSTDNINWNAVSMTAQSILSSLLTVDGNSSGLDSDLLDGKHASEFASSTHSHHINQINELETNLNNINSDINSLNTKIGGIYFKIENDLLKTSTDNINWNAVSMTAQSILSSLLTVDGVNSGLDSDLLDGKHASEFALAIHEHSIEQISELQSILDNKSQVHQHPYASDTHPAVIASSDILGHIKPSSSISINVSTGIATVIDNSHNHLWTNITNAPTSLPANGGNADTVDNKHASDFASSIHNHLWTNITNAPTSLPANGGNADTATKLATARTITLSGGVTGSITFDGSDNINIITTVTNDSHTHSNYLGASATAVDAAKWATSRTITLSGDLSGSVSIDGSANVTLNATVVDDSHAHIIDNIDGLSTALNAKLNSSSYTAADVKAKLLTVDGTGSNIDADLVDGWEAAQLYRKLSTKTAGEFYTGTTAPTSSNRVNFDGYFYATRVYNAWYNDYAEYFKKGEETEPGDIVMIDPNTGKYIKAVGYANKLVRGVHSNEYGHCIGGDGTPDVEEKFIPLGLAGKVHVKIIGKAKIGQNIICSNIPGVGIAIDDYIPGAIIGQCEENKNTNDIEKIKMFIIRM